MIVNRHGGKILIAIFVRMKWTVLTDPGMLDAIDTRSKESPVLLFKHSTRCSISRAALARLERAWSIADDEAHTAYYLDLLSHRALSNAIAERYAVEHQSPQVLVIHHGRCVYTASHFGISYAETITSLKR